MTPSKFFVAMAFLLLMGCRAGDSTAPSEGRDSVVVHGGLGTPKPSVGRVVWEAE